MIKRVWGKNFGILKQFSVDLEPLTFLAGPNASGKSTFLRAIRCLAMLTRVPLYGQSGRFRLGFQASLEDLFPVDHKEHMTLGIEVETDSGSGQYEATFGYVRDRLNFTDEKVIWRSASDGPSFEFNGSSAPLRFGYVRGIEVTSDLPRLSSLMFVAYPYRSDPSWSKMLEPLWELARSFVPFFVYRFSPSELTSPVPLNTKVAFDGRGLVAALEDIATTRVDEFNRIVKGLQNVFGHVKAITLPTIPDPRGGPALKTIVFERQDGVKVPGEFESDGVILTLAHLWLSSLSYPAIGVEEPETATYPSLVATRLELLRQMSQGKFGRQPVQVLATTHSAALLMELEEPDMVRVFDQDAHGFVQIEAPVELKMTAVIQYYLGKLATK